jgi:hypothetical protein
LGYGIGDGKNVTRKEGKTREGCFCKISENSSRIGRVRILK